MDRETLIRTLPESWVGIWAYRDLLAGDGPVARISSKKVPSGILPPQYETHVDLDPALRPAGMKAYALYGNSDGSGTDRKKLRSVLKGISEAIERWAFYQTTPSQYAGSGGARGVDDSTAGFAAFPEYEPRRSREKAYAEAVERWTLLEFHRGNTLAVPLPCSVPQVELYELKRITDGYRVVIARHRDREIGRSSYGFSCAKSLDFAIHQSLVELERNIRALSVSGESALLEDGDLFERRLSFFSTGAGSERFEELLEMNSRAMTTAPHLGCDTEIRGPWSRYAKVWRCSFSDDWSELCSDSVDTFYF